MGGCTIRRLDLNDNRLTTLPEDIFATLTMLERLYMYKNDLTFQLPRELFKPLTNLQFLHLANNHLERIYPDQFSTLTQLTRLWLNNNQIIYLDADTFVEN